MSYIVALTGNIQLGDYVVAWDAKEAAEKWVLATYERARATLLQDLAVGCDWLTDLGADVEVDVAFGRQGLFFSRHEGPVETFRVKIEVVTTVTATKVRPKCPLHPKDPNE